MKGHKVQLAYVRAAQNSLYCKHFYGPVTGASGATLRVAEASEVSEATLYKR